MCRVHSALSRFSPSPCLVTFWLCASHLILSLVACHGSETSSLWARWSQCGSSMARGSQLKCYECDTWLQLPGSDTCSGSLLQTLTEDNKKGGDPALCMTLPERETLSPRVWLAQNQDGLLQIQLHLFFRLQLFSS